MLLADPAIWGGLRNLAFWSWVGKNSPVNSVPGDFLFPDFTFPGAGPLFSLANSDHKRDFIIVQHRLRKHCTRTFGRFTKWRKKGAPTVRVATGFLTVLANELLLKANFYMEA